MTTYTFTTTRTDLGLEPGWQELFGDTGALKPVGGVINRSTTATAEHFYAEGSLVSGSMKAGYQFGTVVSSSSPNLCVMGSGTAGSFTGYYLFPQSATVLQLRRKIAGAITTLISTITVPATANTTFLLECVVGGSSNTITVYDASGTALSGGSVVDSAVGRPTSGYNGLYYYTTAASSSNNGTNFQSGLAVGGGGGGGGASVGGLLLMGVG